MGPESSNTPAWTASELAGDPHASRDKPTRVRRMFEAIAPAYDLNNRLHSFWRDQAWRQRAAELAQVRPDDDVLDVACGTGDLAERLAAMGPRRVTGVDFTEAMLTIARRKAIRLPPERRPEYRLGDAMSLEAPDASVDIVTIAFGIRNVADPARALAEFRRVLRPGGRLVILEFTRPPNAVVRFLHGVYCNHLMPISAALIARDRAGAYRYLPRSVDTFLDHAGLALSLERAGFSVAHQELMTFGVVAATLAINLQAP